MQLHCISVAMHAQQQLRFVLLWGCLLIILFLLSACVTFGCREESASVPRCICCILHVLFGKASLPRTSCKSSEFTLSRQSEPDVQQHVVVHEPSLSQHPSETPRRFPVPTRSVIFSDGRSWYACDRRRTDLCAFAQAVRPACANPTSIQSGGCRQAPCQHRLSCMHSWCMHPYTHTLQGCHGGRPKSAH